VTSNDVADAEVTVSVVVPVTEPIVAVMVLCPAAMPVAKPFVGTVLLIVTMDVSDDDQSALEVRFLVLLSLNVPVAMNWIVVCRAILGLAGATAIDTSAGATVTETLPVKPCIVAVMLVCPLATAVSVPEELTVATLVCDEAQDTELVMSRPLPSLKKPVAVICSACPTTMFGFGAVSSILAKTDDIGVCWVLVLQATVTTKAAKAINETKRRITSSRQIDCSGKSNA